jgi:hypothetical protein
MEKDLHKIKQLGKLKEDENYQFRAYLKGSPLPSKKIDELVHKFYREFSSQIDCKECANCCKVLSTVVDEEDIEKLAKKMRISPAEFDKTFVRFDKEWGEKELKEMPCPFLEDNRCQYYEIRPKECASYPYLHKEHFTFRLLGLIENYSICPIVYNVYEALKNEIWH